MTTFQIVLYAFGGLGIFLYGIYIMGDSLKGLAGSKLKIIIEKSTNKVWKGILVGILLTALIQSSSAMTAILISLIGAGLLTLPQAIPVIMGANIGTTVTAVLVGLNIKDYSLIFIGIGAIIVFFIKQKKVNYAGLALLGFGLLFFGLDTMDKGLMEIVNKPFFKETVENLNNPFLGVLSGTILTGIIQSSSAFIAIVQQVYATPIDGVVGTHAISLIASLSMVIGSNIGTTVTALLSSLSSSRNAKRAALAHLLFNITGCILFLILLYPMNKLLVYLESVIPYLYNSPANTIALFHLVFNITTTFLLCWFVKLLVKIVEKVIPFTAGEKLIKSIDSLEPTLIKKAPVLAIENAKRVTVDMSQILLEMFENAKMYINNNDPKIFTKVNEMEDVIDNYDNKLHDYLAQLSSVSLSSNSIHEQAICFDTIRDFERIADHLINLVEFMNERYESNYTFNENSLQMINHMLDLLSTMIKDACLAFKDDDKKAARRVRATEPQIDELEKKYRKVEIAILTTGGIDAINSDLHFVDMLANLERIGDHCNNIADNILFDSLHDVLEQEVSEKN